jgi:transglutaminase-like putative cysteine protease
MLAVFLVLAGLRAAEAPRYDGPQWSLLDTKQVLAAAADITLAKYPDSDEATVDKKMVRVYRPDGTGEAQDEAFVKVLTEKGKRGNRTLSLSYVLPYFTVEVVKLEVFRPDGTAEPVDVAANSKEMIDDSQMGMNIYDPNSRVLRVNLPKVEIGDVVHSVTRLTVHRSIIPGEFAEYNVIEGSGLIRHLTYTIHAPDERPLKRVFLRDEIPGTVKYSKTSAPNQGTTHLWEVTDVPRMFDEPAMPAYENVLQRLLVSTTPDWQAVSKWYWELSKPHLDATTTDMKKAVQELTAGAGTDLEKVKALFYFVSKKVRYMGLTPEKDRPGYEPHDVNLTFEKKYGVCRDKAALLVSLLRTAGLDAFPVLINVGSKMDQEVASPFFNHAVVSVELKKGEYVLMDPTDENTRELFPAYEANQSYLVCRPEGEDLKLSPVPPAEENMMRLKTTATLSASGTIEAASELSFDGINDNSYRQTFVRMKPDDVRRFFERNLKRRMPGAKLKSLKLTPENMLDVSEGVKARLEFSVGDVAASGNGKAVVSLPWIGKSLGLANMILGNTGLEKRKYPLQTFVACGLKEELSIKLDPAFQKAECLPSCSPIEDPGITYQQSFGFTEHTLTCSRELKLKTVEFNPAEYLKLRRTMELLEYDERKAPVMALSSSLTFQDPVPSSPADERVESNARIVESHKELEIKDANTAIYRTRFVKKILTYSGKVQEAELKLEYNPACQEAKLVRAVVTSKTGQRQEISKDEVNIMDAGWNASAKRYTGGKILVANLPGVDIDSTIEVEFEIASKGKPFISGFESFQLPDELVKKEFDLTAPAGTAVHKLVTGRAGTVREEKQPASGLSYQWRAENMKGLPAETQLPPEWVYNSGVAYFIGDAATYYRELHQAMLDRATKSATAAELARKLTASAKGPLERIKAVRDAVAKSIRIAGPSFTELPLSELSAADTTLADGYGHAADRAILYYAMLSAAGFQPQFVLASMLPPISAITNVSASFPLPHSFASPLVRVAVDGRFYYLNDTDQYSQLGSTMYDGRLGIVLATQTQELINAIQDCDDRHQTLYVLSVSDSGKTRVKLSRKYYGTEFNSKNRFFSELPPEERRRYYQELVASVAQAAHPVGDLVTQFDAYPGLEEFSVDIENYTVVDGKYLYFDLPFTPSVFPPGADSRKLPLFLGRERQQTVRTEIELPPAFQNVVIAPVAQKLDAPAGAAHALVSSTLQGSKYVLEHRFETSPAIVDPKDYAAVSRFETALEKKSSKLFLLQAQN